MSDFDAADRVNAFLRRELAAERHNTSAYEMDPYTRIVYRRFRELCWTFSRLTRNMHTSIFGVRADHSRALAQATPELRAMLLRETPRVFVDVTNLLASRKASGIQRVVREIARHGVEQGVALPVTISDGRLVSALPDYAEAIEPRPGDILLLLDAGWNHVDDFPPMLDAFRSRGGVIVACLYDLFPLLYPTLYVHSLVANFEAWINQIVFRCDAVVAISRSTAESYLDFVQRSARKPVAGQNVGWWRLGSNVVEQEHAAPSEAVRAIVARGPFYLGVGTVEMRKAYPVALEAFEELWREGMTVNFVVVGRPGWNATAFEQRLREHPEKGRRLFWLEDADDADLVHLYKECRGVLLTTFAEGFGLPLVEAAQFGAPVIASDIGVFHEIAGDGVRYFNLLDPADLVARLRETLSTPKIAPRISTVTWSESATELLQILLNRGYQRTT